MILAYLAATVLLGVTIGRRIRTGKDFFLGGRRLPWWAIGMSLVATDIGGKDIIGVGGAAYDYGLAVGNFEWIGCVPAMIVAAFVFIPFFWRTGVYTIPEYMERRFNQGVRTSLAVCWLIFIACSLGVMLFASGKMMSELFGWEITACMLITAVLAGLYTCVGGLAAVVYTDMIQCTIMIGGCFLVLVIGLVELGGIDGMVTKIETRQQEISRDGDGGERMERTSLILPVDTGSPFPWTGILFGLTFVLAPAYWMGHQAIVQRSLGAKSEFQAKASYIWASLLKSLIPIVIAVPGLVAFALDPQLVDGDRAVPMLVSSLLPTGLKGLFLAAFLAALMSSVDSYLNSGATILSHDIYRRYIRRAASDEHLLIVGRLTTLVLVVWAAAFGLTVSRMEGTGIYAIFQTLLAFFQGPALALLLTGVFWKRANGTGALAGFLGGVATAILLFALSQESVVTRFSLAPLFQISEPYLYFSVWAFLVSTALIVLVSLLTKPETEEKLRGVTYWTDSRSKA